MKTVTAASTLTVSLTIGGNGSAQSHGRREPRLYLMHFWAHNDALKLAAGLKAALAHINIAKS
jgi:hypothetical protein